MSERLLFRFCHEVAMSIAASGILGQIRACICRAAILFTWRLVFTCCGIQCVYRLLPLNHNFCHAEKTSFFAILNRCRLANVVY